MKKNILFVLLWIIVLAMWFVLYDNNKLSSKLWKLEENNKNLTNQVDKLNIKINSLSSDLDKVKLTVALIWWIKDSLASLSWSVENLSKALNSNKVTSLLSKIDKKVNKSTTYVYANTLLPVFGTVKVEYWTWKGNYTKSFVLPDNEKNKWIIIFKDLKPKTKYYYKIVWDAKVISESYFETQALPIIFEVKNQDKLTINNWVLDMKFKEENIKKIDNIVIKEQPKKFLELQNKLFDKEPSPNWEPWSWEHNPEYKKLLDQIEKNKKEIKINKLIDSYELKWLTKESNYEINIEYTDIYNQTGSSYVYIDNLKLNTKK